MFLRTFKAVVAGMLIFLEIYPPKKPFLSLSVSIANGRSKILMVKVKVSVGFIARGQAQKRVCAGL